MNRWRVWLGLFLLIGTTGFSQSGSTVLLPWGTGEGELGVFRDGDWIRGPLFFSVGPDGTILVADAYKSRIARFSAAGTFLGAIPVDEVSPRMTAFERTSDGTYLLSNDQSISRWSSEGLMIGRKGLGLALPEAYWFTSQAAAVILKTDEGTATVQWSRDLASETQFSWRGPSGPRAAVRDERDQIWLTIWEDQVKVFGWKSAVEARARLVGVMPSGDSLWTFAKDGEQRLWRVTPNGAVSGVVRWANRTGPGSGLWAVGGPAGRFYQGSWTEKGLEIHSLDWSAK